MSAKKSEDVKPEAPVDDLQAEREAALKEGKTVVELPKHGGTAPALRVDH